MVTRLDQVSEGAKVPWAAFTIVTPEIDKLPPAIISRCETLRVPARQLRDGTVTPRKLCEP